MIEHENLNEFDEAQIVISSKSIAVERRNNGKSVTVMGSQGLLMHIGSEGWPP